MYMSFHLFSQIMEHIVSTHKLNNSIYNAVYVYNKETNDCADFSFMPTVLEDDLVMLLEILTSDDDGWISYWLYELECGEKYVDGCIVDEDDKPIKCKTIKDLYNLLKSSNI